MSFVNLHPPPPHHRLHPHQRPLAPVRPLLFVYSVGVAYIMVVRVVVKVAVKMVGVEGQRGVMGHGLVLLSYPQMHYGQ